MRIKNLMVLFLAGLILSCETKVEKEVVDYQTPFELGSGNETGTYDQILDFYIRLAKEFPEINIQSIGETDIGLPLHVVTYNPDGDFNFEKIRENKSIILINNGIHPGESDGIDASLMLFRDLAIGKIQPPEKTVIATIPVYNIGGALNRNGTSRVNQNGPANYGFRGNAKNYDLNRDFIKADTKNAASFAEIFHLLKPDVFVDTHVSNGADYQYTLTHLFTQHNKLGGNTGRFMNETWQPALEKELASEGWDITPYVNVFNRVPESGFSQFMDYPRYSTGYTTLWNTLGMMVETHMLKPYANRVTGTYALLKSMVHITETYGTEIKEVRKNDLERLKKGGFYSTRWKIDSTRVSQLNFKGYHADTIPSKVTGLPRLKYDQNRPFEKEISYYNYFVPADSIAIPSAYVIPLGWADVRTHLDRNDIQYTLVEQDTALLAEVYHIDNYRTRVVPYEGHYPHHNTTVTASMDSVDIKEGSIWIPTDQPGVRYLLETLEPSAPDSFFNWNFFDPILQRKEGFSPYVFEELMEQLLEEDQDLRIAYEAKKKADETFSRNAYRQLSWLYEQSPYAEKEYKRYPVVRIVED